MTKKESIYFFTPKFSIKPQNLRIFCLDLKRSILISFLVGLLLTAGIIPALSQIPTPHSEVQLIEKGKEFYAKDRFEAAAEVWQKAAQMYENQGDNTNRAIALTYLSLAYQKLARWSEAQKAIETSIALIDDSPFLLAQALNARGRLELALGKPEIALDTWKLATRYYERAGDETGTTGSLINQAQAMEALGLYRRTCKTLLQALKRDRDCNLSEPTQFEAVLQAFKQQQNAQIKILGLRSLGDILRLMGELDLSQQLLAESLKVPQSPEETSATLLSLGKTERARYSQAKNLYKRTQLKVDHDLVIDKAKTALNYYQQAASQSDSKSREISAKLQKLSLLLDWKQWLEQFNDRNRAISLSELESQINSQVADLQANQIDRTPPSRTAIYAQLNFARALKQIKRNDLAIHYAAKALEQAKVIQDQRSESYALGTLGNLYEQAQQWSEAQKLTEQALGLAQANQATDIAYQWQWQLGRIYQAIGRTNEAIASYNAAVTTLDAVRQDLLAIDAEVQFSFRENVELVYRELVNLLLATKANSQPTQENIKQATQVIDSLQLAELEDFLSCDLAPSIELSEKAIDPTAAIIYPIILRDRLEVILKLPQSAELRRYTTVLPQSQVEQTLDNLRRELEQLYPSQEGKILSQQVYNWLIQPAQPALEQEQIKTLVFVLDGAFRNVPMAALYDGQKYLIEKGYAVAVIPGLKLLAPEPIRQIKLNTLAFGLSQVREDFPPHQGFSPLINVKTELEQIRAQVPSRELLDRDFTSTALQDLIGAQDFPVVHLATHGQFSSDPKETFILAWDKRIDVRDLSNILNRSDRTRPEGIELLVLSACKTADGDDRAALGIAGVAIQSGARSIVASLWDVNDRSTAKLMSLFYQELVQNSATISKAEALRRAQLSLLNTSGYNLPRFWASYVLVGNWL
jgi:CHAT domain-containing protein